MATKDDRIRQLEIQIIRLTNEIGILRGSLSLSIKDRKKLLRDCERYRLKFHELRKLLGVSK